MHTRRAHELLLLLILVSQTGTRALRQCRQNGEGAQGGESGNIRESLPGKTRLSGNGIQMGKFFLCPFTNNGVKRDWAMLR